MIFSTQNTSPLEMGWTLCRGASLAVWLAQQPATARHITTRRRPSGWRPSPMAGASSSSLSPGS